MTDMKKYLVALVLALLATCSFAQSTSWVRGNSSSYLVNDPNGITQGLSNYTGTIPLSLQTPIASLGLLPLPGNQTVAGDAVNGVILNTQLPAESAFFGTKLIYLNFDTVNTMSIDGVKVAAAPSSIAGGNSSLTWSGYVTVSGSQSFSVPVATLGAGGQLIPGVTVTDFTQVTSIARTDVSGAPPLLRVATHLAPSSNSTNHPAFNGSNYSTLNALSANPGLIYGTYEFSGSGATLSQLTSTGNSVLNSGGVQNPISAIFYYSTVHPDIFIFGDSIFQGHGTTSNLAGLSEYATFNSYGNATQFAGANFATSGQLTVDTMARLKSVISTYQPKYVLIKSWSPNDTPINTQSTFDQTWGYVLEMVRYSLSLGVQPIVAAGPSANGYNCQMVQRQNARVMGLPASVRKLDLFDLWTPNCVWNSNYYFDGTHPNDAGNSAAGNLLLQSITY